MSQLGPEARRLIAAAKHADDPSFTDRARMRERLDASWASAAGATPLVNGKRGALGVKLVTGMTLLGLSGFGALHFTGKEPPPVVQAPRAVARGAEPSQVRVQDATAPRAVARGAESSQARAPDATLPRLPLPPELPELRRTESPRTARPQPRAARAAPQPLEAARRPEAAKVAALEASPPPPAASRALPPDAAVHVRAPLTTSSSSPRKPSEPVLQEVDEELALLGAAQDALQAGKPSSSLQLVQQHAFRFPRGALARERLTVEALALCALQRKSSARQVLNELERRAKGSPVLARVRADCGFDAD